MNVTVREVRTIVETRRKPIHVAPREAAALKDPIIGLVDFLGTMKGYRRLRGLSQLAADDAGGLTEGHVGKLEIDTRRALTATFWYWIGLLRLAMILVPAEDACDPTKCALCNRTHGLTEAMLDRGMAILREQVDVDDEAGVAVLRATLARAFNVMLDQQP